MASSAELAGAEENSKRIIIVMGPGRSGTSTVAGALAKSGLEVPGQVIRGNPTNPSGFYEPRWVVDFHRDLLDRHYVGTIDTSPSALELMSKASAAPTVRETLHTWLAARLEVQPRLVVKDPRSIWFRDLWVDTARELGVEPGFVTMLRHPAEVSASRHKYYRRDGQPSARSDEINRIAGWVNVVLTAEQSTKGSPRIFVRYTDLVADWRRVLGRLGHALNVDYDPGLDVSPHPVDDFIDSSLHRVQVDWTDVDIPLGLRDMGEELWRAASRLADEGESDDASAEIDRLRHEYAVMMKDALALTRQTSRRSEVAARRRGRRQFREELARKRAASAASAASAKSAGRGRADRLWSRITRGGRV